MLIPIVMDHRGEFSRVLVGQARDTKEGLVVSMHAGREITEDQLAATFGMAGVEIRRYIGCESGRPMICEFIIKEFSLCAASLGDRS